MLLTPGTRLGFYEITGSLGAGGMGEVYRARDLRLRREVAIKILPSGVADDPERLARLEREAHVLASLNHPHIAQIYGLEESGPVRALVIELVDGEDLSRRILRGPVAIGEALSIARQICEAVESAHQRGIVHRDLKPANILLTPEGIVKVLDFGLAKAVEPQAGAISDAETIGALPTERGVIAGTPAYMSPEQLAGKDIDKRTDIWAFGCVLYELLTANRAFAGDDAALTFQSVLAGEPDFTRLPADTPDAIRRLLRRCLQKDRKQRLHDMADVRIELQDAADSSKISVAAVVANGGRRERLAWSLAAVCLVAFMTALAWGAIVYFTRATLDQPAYRSSIVIPPDIRVSGPPSQRFALSPDGRFLALAAVAEDGEARLWVHSFESASVRPLSGTEGGTAPFWSPDGRFLGFFANDKLKKIDLAGGPPVTLADVDGAAGASWSTNDVILFASSRSALRTVPASGGNPALVTSLDAGNGEVTHVSPAFLPDGRHFLFHAAGSKEGGSFDPNGIYVGVIGSWERKLLVGEGSNAQYAAGYLLFLRQRALMAQSFDVELLELTKDPIVVAEQIAAGPFLHTGAFSVSTTGALAYQTNQPQPPSQLVWFDRTGKRLGALGEPAFYRHPELSPDGTQVAIAILDPITNTNDLWLIDVARGVRTRFTVAHTEERFPTWSSDGNRVAFTSGRGGRFDVFVQTSNGSRGEERLTHDLENKYPTSWSPDGRTILFYTGGSTQGSGNDLWILPLFGDRKPLQFLQTPFNELEGRFSPDGRWIAYQSTESGRMEVYAAAVSDPGRKSRVSAGGGTHPRWARAGREILYLAPDGKLMAAGVQLREATIEIGSPKPMFQTRLAHPSWTLSSDGEKFLLNTMLEETADAPIMLFLNWSAALSRLGSPAP